MKLTTRGIIIKKTNLGEADRIFTIMTADRGKIRVVAKGVRRGKAKLAGYLELLRCNDLELAEGRNMDIITGAATVANFGEGMEDLTAFGVKLHLCELVEKLIEEDAPAPGVFDLLYEVLEAIHKQTLPALLAKSFFEIKLLSVLGVAPQLQHSVVTGGALTEGERIFFSAHLGGVVQDGEPGNEPGMILISINALKLLRALTAWPIEKVARLKLDPGVVSEAEYVSADYLNYALEYRSKTLRVMGELGE